MLALECEAVEIDYCPACEGVWLDAGELEILFGDAQAGAAYLQSAGEPHAVLEKPRRCPICGARMEKRLSPGETSILFDRCPRLHGLWLDKGELEAMLAHAPAAKAHSTVVKLLRGMFHEDKEPRE